MSSETRPCASSAPLRIRLYDAPAETATDERDDAPRLSGECTLREFYERHVRPICLANARPKTLKEYATSLRYWEALSGDPPLRLIDDLTCADFRAALGETRVRGQKLAQNSIRKHCNAIKFCLEKAGPRNGRNPNGAELLERVPFVAAPPVERNEVDDNFTLAEIAGWLEACPTAIAPRLPNIAPGEWWEPLVLATYNTGLRIETMLALRRLWLVEDELGWWFRVPAAAIKGRRARRFYCPPAAYAAIQALPQRGELIFAWPHTEHWLHEVRRRILAASTIAPHRRFGFHALRKAFATELGKINGLAVAMALGHAGNVTIDHYTHRQVMVEAMNKLPQPVWRRDRVGRQRLLFD